MPTYEYRCTECGHEMEAFQKMTDAHLMKCPKCSKETLRRGPGGGIGLSFKGPGFYVNDYGHAEPPACPCGKGKEHLPKRT